VVGEAGHHRLDVALAHQLAQLLELQHASHGFFSASEVFFL
jgi:hypothetical protein